MDKPVQQHPVTVMLWDYLSKHLENRPQIMMNKIMFAFGDEAVEITVRVLSKPKD